MVVVVVWWALLLQFEYLVNENFAKKGTQHIFMEKYATMLYYGRSYGFFPSVIALNTFQYYRTIAQTTTYLSFHIE